MTWSLRELFIGTFHPHDQRSDRKKAQNMGYADIDHNEPTAKNKIRRNRIFNTFDRFNYSYESNDQSQNKSKRVVYITKESQWGCNLDLLKRLLTHFQGRND